MMNSNEDQNNNSIETGWKSNPDLKSIKDEVATAGRAHSAQIAKINNWLAHLYVEDSCKPKPVEGKSSYVPKLIRKQYEWRIASLIQPFLTSPQIFKTAPRTHKDVERAKVSEILLNYQFESNIDKVKFIDDYFRMAVYTGTVICRVGWKRKEVVEVKDNISYEYVLAKTDEEVEEIQSAMLLMEEDPSSEELVPEQIKIAIEKYMLTSQVYYPKEIGREEVSEKKVTHNQPTVQVCDHSEVIIDPTCRGNLDDANFVVFKIRTSINQLSAEGIYSNLDLVEKLQSAQINGGEVSDRVRPFNAEGTSEGEFNFDYSFSDDRNNKITAYEYWTYHDIEDNGHPVPVVITYVGDVIIRMERNPFPDQKFPVTITQYTPVFAEIYGEPDAEFLIDSQNIVGAISRGVLDIMSGTAAGQTGLRKDSLDQVNMTRYLNGEKFFFNNNTDMQNSVYKGNFPDIPISAMALIQSHTQDADSITGVNTQSRGISGENLGNVAAGVHGALAAASKRESVIFVRLLKGIIDIGHKFMSMNTEFLDKEEVIRITDEDFMPVSSDKIISNIDIKLDLQTAEEDEMQSQRIAFLLQTSSSTAPEEVTKLLLGDLMRLHKKPDLAKQIEDYQQEPSEFQISTQKLELEKIQADINYKKAMTQERIAEAKMHDAQSTKFFNEAELAKSRADKLDLDYLEQNLGVTNERDKEKITAQSKGNQQLEILKAKIRQIEEK